MLSDFDLNSLSRLRQTVTRVFTAENPEGKPGCGGSADEGDSKPRGEHQDHQEQSLQARPLITSSA